jgi:hypothetical protein
MEKRRLLLLRYLIEHCGDGYKVLDVKKIFSKIKKYRNSFDFLSKDIHFLSQHKYIDLKHIDKTNICLSILDNCHVYQDNLKSDKLANRKYLLSVVINMIISGVMAFAGAFLAILIFR